MVRPCDRLRSALVLVGLLFAVALLSLCWLPGTLVQHFEQQQSAYDAAHSHRVTATTTAASIPAGSQPFAGSGGFDTTVTWTYPAGQTHRILLATPRAQVRGDTIQVWVNDSGEMVTPPRSHGAIQVDALWTDATSLLAEALLAAAAVAGVRGVLDRRAQRAWEREWERVEPRWTGRAGRSPA